MSDLDLTTWTCCFCGEPTTGAALTLVAFVTSEGPSSQYAAHPDCFASRLDKVAVFDYEALRD